MPKQVGMVECMTFEALNGEKTGAVVGTPRTPRTGVSQAVKWLVCLVLAMMCALWITPYALAEGEGTLTENITDPQNLGAVIRSAAAFGANGVILPERRSASVTAAAWKVSAGAAAHLPVCRVVNLTKAIEALKARGYYAVGLDGGGDKLVGETGFETDPLVVVLGSEGKGLSRLVREACDAIAGIPISSQVESLNASVAAGISLYAVARERRRAAEA